MHPHLLIFKLDENGGTQSSFGDAVFTIDISWFLILDESFSRPSNVLLAYRHIYSVVKITSPHLHTLMVGTITEHLYQGSEPRVPVQVSGLPGWGGVQADGWEARVGVLCWYIDLLFCS